MSFSENATVFMYDADPKLVAAAKARGEIVVVLPRSVPMPDQAQS